MPYTVQYIKALAESFEQGVHDALGVKRDKQGRRVFPPTEEATQLSGRRRAQSQYHCYGGPILAEDAHWRIPPRRWPLWEDLPVKSFARFGGDDCAPADSDSRLRASI